MANTTTKTVEHHAITLDLADLNAFEQRARQATTVGGIFLNGTLAVLEDNHELLVEAVAKLKGQDCEPEEIHELLRFANNHGPEEYSTGSAVEQYHRAKDYASRGMVSHALICYWQCIAQHQADAEREPELSQLKGTLINRIPKRW